MNTCGRPFSLNLCAASRATLSTASPAPRRSDGWVVALLFVMLLPLLLTAMQGCAELSPERIQREPGAPMLLLKASGRATVAMYDPATGTLVEAGEIDLGQYSGWTISAHDWSKVTGQTPAKPAPKPR